MANSRELSFHIRALLVIAAVFPVLLLLTAALFPGGVVQPGMLVRNCGMALGAALLLILLVPRVGAGRCAALLTVGVIWIISLLFDASASVQHLFVTGWKDAELVALDRVLFGEELSVAMQRIVHPALTEWLMASYVLYVPLLPFTAWICFRFGGSAALEEFLLNLLTVNVLCGIGFILYPVASQMYYASPPYTVPLEGGLFTTAAEWMRTNVHYPGGSLPSPHCAAGTVMLVHLLRNRRWLGYTFAPLLASIPFATVYGRFHYVWDGVAGVILGLSVLALSWKHMLVRLHSVRVVFGYTPSYALTSEGERS